jgi:hypothetical protein
MGLAVELARVGGRRSCGSFAAVASRRSTSSSARSARQQAGIRLHRPRFLDDLDFAEHRGIPITTVARTLLECAAPGLGIDIGALMYQAITLQVFDAGDGWDVLARHPTHRGARRLDGALREEHPVTRSGLEDAMVALSRRCRQRHGTPRSCRLSTSTTSPASGQKKSTSERVASQIAAIVGLQKR